MTSWVSVSLERSREASAVTQMLQNQTLRARLLTSLGLFLDYGLLLHNQIREELATRTKPLARRTLRVR